MIRFCVLARSVPGAGVWWIICDWNSWSLVQNGAKHERKQIVSSLISVYSCIFINPAWVSNILWLQKTAGRAYLGGFQPSALLSLQNQRVLEPDVLAVCRWGAQMISAPFCASQGKGKEWNLGTSSLSQMPWGNPYIKHRHALVQFVAWNKVDLVVFIFKSIFYS